MGRVTAEDWARAALAALADGGIAAVAVEPVAVRLGVSKGSFYWHFANRRALLEAALAVWESGTEAVVAELERIPDPSRRLDVLIAHVQADPADAAIHLWLVSAADEPVVGPVVRRVTDRRLQVMEDAVRLLGHPPEEARARVVQTYAGYLGVAALLRIGSLTEVPAQVLQRLRAQLGP